MKGVLHLWSETGTEGGYWAFQDAAHIRMITPEYGIWPNSKVWDARDPERTGMMLDHVEVSKAGEWLPLPDPLSEDPSYMLSSLWVGQERGNKTADTLLMARYGFEINYLTPDAQGRVFGTPRTTPRRPYGCGLGEQTRGEVKWDDGEIEECLSSFLLVERWDYKGNHTLKDGDHLIIYDKDAPDRVVWDGFIKLKQLDLFTEDASGYWIHSDMEGWDRDAWAKLFFEGYPAELELA